MRTVLNEQVYSVIGQQNSQLSIGVLFLAVMKQTLLATIGLPYSGKFSRGPIFADFAVDWQTTKIKPAKIKFLRAIKRGRGHRDLHAAHQFVVVELYRNVSVTLF